MFPLLPFELALLTLSACASAKPGIPFRPPHDPAIDTAPDVPTTNSWQHAGDDDSPNISNPNVYNDPPDTNEIEYQPAENSNSCLTGEKCEEIAEVAEEVLKQVVDNLSPGGSSSSSSTPNASVTQKAMNGTLYTTTTPTPLPNADTADLVANLGVDESFMGLLDQDQQNMFANDPVCFFAAAYRLYSSAATPTPTSNSNNKRQDCQGIYGPCTSQPTTSSIAASETSSIENAYFGSELPYQILSVYAPVTTGTLGTVSTSCTGFDGVGFGTRVVRGVTATVSAVATASEVGEVTGGVGRVRGSWGGVVVLVGGWLLALL